MSHTINISRAAPVTVRRGSIRFGQVFAAKKADGSLGQSYLGIGKNGRLYSVNASTKELASASNVDRNVNLTGTWVLRTTMLPLYGQRKTTRSDVRPGEIFTVAGGSRKYAHMGRIAKDQRGWLSVPLDNTDNHAVTRNGESNVTVVGTFGMNVTLTR